MSNTPDLSVTHEGHVALIEICRPPHNFFDFELIQQIANVMEELDQNPNCRAIVLASQGTAFCAGANFNSPDDKISRPENPGTNPLYFEAIRIFSCKKPIVAAIHGAAVGGGLGLALVADFRVTCAEGRFSANFNRLGFHPGFGLSVTLPRLVGIQKANLLLFTGRRINGQEALDMGLAGCSIDSIPEKYHAPSDSTLHALVLHLRLHSGLVTGLAQQAHSHDHCFSARRPHRLGLACVGPAFV